MGFENQETAIAEGFRVCREGRYLDSKSLERLWQKKPKPLIESLLLCLHRYVGANS
jgi:hypothetical protein